MSSLGGQETNERELFEQAQAKLEEAFALLRTLEGQLRSNEERRVAVASEPASLDAQRREEERARLLAYVENAHNEALQLAARTRPLNGAQRRELVRRITERFEKVIARLDVRDNGDAPWEAEDEPVMPEKLPEVERGSVEITKIRAVGVDTGSAPATESEIGDATPATEVMVATLAPIPVPVTAKTDLADAETEIAPSPGLSLPEDDGDVDVTAAATTRPKADRARAETEIAPPRGPFAPLPWDLDDDDTGAAFAPREGLVPTLVTENPLLEREKAGARQRRDRSPTEVTEREPRRTRLFARPLVRHSAIVVAVAMLIGALVGVSVRAARTTTSVDTTGALPVAPTTTSTTEDTTRQLMGPPNDLAPRPAPRRTSVQANPQRRTPARCTTAKCRASRASHAGRIGTLARR